MAHIDYDLRKPSKLIQWMAKFGIILLLRGNFCYARSHNNLGATTNIAGWGAGMGNEGSMQPGSNKEEEHRTVCILMLDEGVLGGMGSASYSLISSSVRRAHAPLHMSYHVMSCRCRLG